HRQAVLETQRPRKPARQDVGAEHARRIGHGCAHGAEQIVPIIERAGPGGLDRKSTRLNSSHSQISYAVFCLKKKKKKKKKKYDKKITNKTIYKNRKIIKTTTLK